jgi:hypothetical protein
MFKKFSWSRVRFCLLNIERAEHYIIDNKLHLYFLYHRHAITIGRDGRGILSNPWNENDRKFNFLSPKDVQVLVNDILDAYALTKITSRTNNKMLN